MNIHAIFIVKDPNVVKQLSSYLLYKYVIVPADKAPNNNVFPCKYTLQNTEGAIKNGQSRETGYTGHTS